MNWITQLFSRRRLDDDLAEEIRLHLEEKIEELIAAGLSRPEAIKAAHREFGNVGLIEQQGREVWRWVPLEGFIQDVRYAGRTLRRSPGFTAVAVLTIALGLGANATIFSLVYPALLRPLPYREADQLLTLGEYRRGTGQSIAFTACYPDYVDWSRSAVGFKSLAGFQPEALTLSGTGEPKPVFAAQVTPNFFATLGASPALGRDFTDSDQQPVPSYPQVAILSYTFWQNEFGADPGVIGGQVRLDNRPVTIVGVMPRSFEFGPANSAEVWVPLRLDQHTAVARDFLWLSIVGRLATGVSIEQARAEMEGIAAELSSQYPQASGATAVYLQPLQERIVGNVRPLLLVLFGAVGFVLMIACANVGNLMLSRSLNRRKELAIRRALGASRARLVSQLLTESLLLSSLAGAIGLVLAMLAVGGLITAIPESWLRFVPYLRDATVNGPVVTFLFGVTILTAVVFGLVPGLAASRIRSGEVLKEKTRGSSPGGRRIRDILVIAEIAICLILLVGAGLMLRSLHVLLRQDAGFETRNLLAFYLSLPATSYPPDDQKPFEYPRSLQFERQFVERLNNLPGVQGASATSALPLLGNRTPVRFVFEGRPAPPGEEEQCVIRTVDKTYFSTMKVPLRSGRAFADTDTYEAPQVAVVNRAFVSKYFHPGEDPIGKRVRLTASSVPSFWQIIGVVGDVAEDSLAVSAPEVIYFPVEQLSVYSSWLTYVVRTSGDVAGFVRSVSESLRQLDPQLAINRPVSVDQIANQSPAVFLRRYPSYLIGSFAAIALVLAMTGLYGVISYTVDRRRGEIGIRMALGAGRRDVLLGVLGEGMIAAMAGVALGVAGALLLARLMSSLLYGVTAHDVLTFALVSVLLIVVAVASCLIPARRATLLDPAVALRHE